MVEVGRVDLGRTTPVANAAREGARYATVARWVTKSNSCPVGPPGLRTTVIPAASVGLPLPVTVEAGRSRRSDAGSFTIAGGTSIVVTACYGSGCAGNTNAWTATNARGTAVTVTVTSQVSMMVGSLLGLGSFDGQRHEHDAGEPLMPG